MKKFILLLFPFLILSNNYFYLTEVKNESSNTYRILRTKDHFLIKPNSILHSFDMIQLVPSKTFSVAFLKGEKGESLFIQLSSGFSSGKCMSKEKLPHYMTINSNNFRNQTYISFCPTKRKVHLGLKILNDGSAEIYDIDGAVLI